MALVRPNKTLSETSVRSVKRKMKDKNFAKSINRDDIMQGAEELGVDLDEHIAFVDRGAQARCVGAGSEPLSATVLPAPVPGPWCERGEASLAESEGAHPSPRPSSPCGHRSVNSQAR